MILILVVLCYVVILGASGFFYEVQPIVFVNLIKHLGTEAKNRIVLWGRKQTRLKRIKKCEI